MSKKKVYYWLLQVFGWGVFHFLVAANAYGQDKLSNKYLTVIVLLFAMALIVSHIIRAIFIRWDWLSLSIFKLTPRVFLISFIGASAIYFSQFLSGAWYYNNILDLLNKPILDHFTSILSWWIMLIIWCAIYLAYHFFNKSKKEEIKNLQLKASQNEIELNQLRSQMNPHFIFNSLNSIKALISESPKDAKKAIGQLSTILRSSLQSGREKTITIQEELNTVKAYLTLEKIRFEERLSYSINAADQVSPLPIPPLMLQTIVENAVKHGISKIARGGEIVINITRDENYIVILVTNDGTLEVSYPDRKGIGVSNTKKRLEILYGNNYYWDLKEEDKKVIAQIKYPYKTTLNEGTDH